MAGVWTAHDRAARDLLPAWRGREIDKTDGMLLLFDTRRRRGAATRVAYHRALAALPMPLKARAGLHVGPVILRENARTTSPAAPSRSRSTAWPSRSRRA